MGIHPWETGATPDFELLERAAAHPSVAAIGETGVDRLRGAGIDTQTNVFRRHIALSESLRKPLILHVVKALDIILAVKKECRPAMPWIWHGFRGNATMAKQLADNGILLSLGSHFNTDAAASVLKWLPSERRMPLSASCFAIVALPRNPCQIHGIAGRHSFLTARIMSRALTTCSINGLRSDSDRAMWRRKTLVCVSMPAPRRRSTPVSPMAATDGCAAARSSSSKSGVAPVSHGCMPTE